MTERERIIQAEAHRVLEEASLSDIGIQVRCHGLPAYYARQQLYTYKKDSTQFSNLHIRFNPDDPENSLWLIRSDTGLVDIQPEPESKSRSELNLEIKL